MRILFITIAFAPDESSESIVNCKLVLALKSEGHHIIVISRKMDDSTYNSEWSEPWISLKKITNLVKYERGNNFYRLLDYARCSIMLFYPLEGVRWIYRAIIQAGKLMKNNQFDVIITRSPSDIPHIVGLKLRNKYKLPWIANWNDPCDGIWPEPYQNSPGKVYKIFSKFYNQKVLSVSDYNTFPSERLRAHFNSYFKFDLKKSEIIPHIGFSHERGSKQSNNNKSLSICHAGNLSEERNPEVLFEVISKIKADFNEEAIIRFSIIGSVNQYIESLIHKYKLKDNIIISGNLPYSDALKFMQQFDILCIIEAKLENGIFLPSKLSDYVSLGKPVFCFSPDNGTLADLINQYGGGIAVNNENGDSVYQGLRNLIICKKENKLSITFDNHKLASYLSNENVLNKYNSIFDRLGKDFPDDQKN